MSKNMNVLRQLPSPDEIKQMYPLSEKCRLIKASRDNEIRDLFTGKDNRFLLVIGPCSADREDAVLEYTYKLCDLQSKVKDKILIIPRVYTNKPRTTGEGYKGIASQPDPNKKINMLEGTVAMRKLHTKVVEQTGFVCADEMLYPENFAYLSDLLGYNAVGARSSENQQHRLVASGIDTPVGMKNPTSGDLSVMLNSIKAAQCSHTFVYRGCEVETKGNDLTHAILRGSVNKHGNSIYHYEDLTLLFELYNEKNLKNMACLIDTNHSNSNKKYLEQIRIAKEVLHSKKLSADINKLVKGLMIESYLKDGAQAPGGDNYGQSITDPCLGWEKTEKLVLEIANLL